jgi:L-2-hydroxyglutarate oxidase
VTQSADLAVVGGGIVGLATALALTEAHPRLRLIVLEKEPQIAAHQTGHNSGVIHSGIYYKPGSLKARTCVEGARRMKQFCDTHGIKWEACGKVIVATDEAELPRLSTIYERGQANGLAGLKMLSAEELREFEPNCRAVRAIHVPETGIVDYVQVSGKMGGGERDPPAGERPGARDRAGRGRGAPPRQLRRAPLRPGGRAHRSDAGGAHHPVPR